MSRFTLKISFKLTVVARRGKCNHIYSLLQKMLIDVCYVIEQIRQLLSVVNQERARL